MTTWRPPDMIIMMMVTMTLTSKQAKGIRVGERWLLTFLRTFIWINFLWMFYQFYQPCVCVLSMWVVIGGSKLISVVTFLGRVVFGSCFGWVGWTGALLYICFEVFKICVCGDRIVDLHFLTWLFWRTAHHQQGTSKATASDLRDINCGASTPTNSSQTPQTQADKTDKTSTKNWFI